MKETMVKTKIEVCFLRPYLYFIIIMIKKAGKPIIDKNLIIVLKSVNNQTNPTINDGIIILYPTLKPLNHNKFF